MIDRTLQSKRGTTRRSALVHIVGVGALPTILAACAAPGSAPSATDAGAGSGADGKTVEIRVHARGGTEDEAFTKRLRAFTEKNPKIKAVYEGLPDYYTALQTQIAGGTVGDLIYAHTSNMRYQEFAVKSVAKNIDPFIAKDKFNLKAWPDKAIEALKSMDGKMYGLPTRGQIAWMYLVYNKDLLQREGVPEPTENWTMDDLLRYATQLTKRAGAEVTTYGLMTQVNNFEQTAAWIRRWNGEFWDPVTAGKKVLLDSAPAVAAFKWLNDGYRGGIINPTFDYADFGSGKVAMVAHRLAGERATIARAVGESFKWTWQFMPKGAGGRQGGYLSIDTEQITTGSKAPDQAWEVLKWITDKDSGVEYALQTQGSLTPGFRKDVYCDDRLINDPRFPKDAMQVNCMNPDKPEGYTWQANLRQTELQTALEQYTLKIPTGEWNPTASALREVTRELQVIADMPRL